MNGCVIEILTEEPSMEIFLRELLPIILPEEYILDGNCFIHPHEGKSDLRKSIPKKMRAYSRWEKQVKVLIIHDQDSNDCLILKNDLLNLCPVSDNIHVVIRIACRELENWYLGDLGAIEKLYPESKASKFEGKAKYRNPDNVVGSREMERLTKNFTKSHASRKIVRYMNFGNNRSKSFNQLLSGLEKLIAM